MHSFRGPLPLYKETNMPSFQAHVVQTLANSAIMRLVGSMANFNISGGNFNIPAARPNFSFFFHLVSMRPPEPQDHRLPETAVHRAQDMELLSDDLGLRSSAQ